ncbi:choice-of-anchor tandem repeat GloVer-containing protein [Sandaracinobacter neustonicus]|nr:choice-of-anchor tandem repeat GloVer-containing protein [Sandaracinobacter neustonicus]
MRHSIMAALFVSAAIATPAAAVTITNLFNFSPASGYSSRGELVADAAGNLYGTTRSGGANGVGTLFRLGTDGVYSVLHNFSSASGGVAEAGLTIDAAGNLYGTTSAGGANGLGTVFRVGTDGYSVLHDFDSAGGGNPRGGVILDSSGNLYGTAYNYGAANRGTIYKISTDGDYTVLHNFTALQTGYHPQAGLTLGADGYLYGTASGGIPAVQAGTIFKLATDGSDYTLLHSFGISGDGRYPQMEMIADAAGNMYGTTNQGGGSGYNSIGTIFRIGTDGEYSVIHTFVGETNGSYPVGNLLLDAAGNLYGTTTSGGINQNGTVFRLSADGDYSVLYKFATYGGYGRSPYAGLLADAEGNLYGSTSSSDGSNLYGSIFKLSDVGYVLPAVTPPPVGGIPEPATWAMLIVGFGLVGVSARRRARIMSIGN